MTRYKVICQRREQRTSEKGAEEPGPGSEREVNEVR